MFRNGWVHVVTALALSLPSPLFGDADEANRRAYLEELLPLLRPHPGPEERERTIRRSFVRLGYHDETWLDWIERTGELPPDLDALPSLPFLPDPLTIDEGGEAIPVKTFEQWDRQREWLKEQVKYWLSGTFPDPPAQWTARVLDKRIENRVRIETIEVRFGDDPRAKMTFEMITPPGDGPFPVFLTQWNHRSWAQIAVRRGYIGVVCAAADAMDDTLDYLALYPKHDWTALMTRAWGTHRVIDYLYTLDSVDKAGIALTGHSRNAKMSVLAAAFDSRIDAVISSSGGTGAEIPYRYAEERHATQAMDHITAVRPQWFHPRLRFFIGRKHKMPIDQNSLLALIAPNALLLTSSIREGFGGDAWAYEQTFRSLENVYSFLGTPERLGIRFRDGRHPAEARDIEDFIDWLDLQFGRTAFPWENRLIHDYTFEKWKSLSGEEIDPEVFAPIQPLRRESVGDWERGKQELRHRLEWILGDEPPGIAARPIESFNGWDDYLSHFVRRPRVSNGRVQIVGGYNTMGDYLPLALYYPSGERGEMKTGARGTLPVVIFLHRYANSGYDEAMNPVLDELLSRGIAVATMDMIGYGTRIEEGTRFYERYPNWSKLGKMVADTRAAIEGLSELDFIDRERIYVGGYALGGTVGLVTAALDDRVAGVAIASAFTPWREASEHHEGVRAFSHLHGLLPRLGFFVGREERIPVDFPEILSLVAPRPLLVISPELDRHADFEAVRRSVEQARSVYSLFERPENLSWETPQDFNRFPESRQKEMAEWFDAVSRN